MMIVVADIKRPSLYIFLLWRTCFVPLSLKVINGYREFLAKTYLTSMNSENPGINESMAAVALVAHVYIFHNHDQVAVFLLEFTQVLNMYAPDEVSCCLCSSLYKRSVIVPCLNFLNTTLTVVNRKYVLYTNEMVTNGLRLDYWGRKRERAWLYGSCGPEFGSDRSLG